MIQFLKFIKSIAFILLLVTTTSSFAQNNDKVFDEDFKERYDGRQFDYSGKEVETYRSGSSTVKGRTVYTEYEKEEKDPKIREENNSVEFEGEPIDLSWIYTIAFIAAIIFLVYTLVDEGSTGWFSNRKNTSLEDPEDFDIVTATPQTFLDLIKNAENAGNFRLAIRYYFLYALNIMSNKKLIKIEEDKTNSEYLNELTDKKINEQFYKVLYVYNYTWYGEFDVSKPQYNTAKSNFNNLLKSIR